jgi:hypothetical protein
MPTPSLLQRLKERMLVQQESSPTLSSFSGEKGGVSRNDSARPAPASFVQDLNATDQDGPSVSSLKGGTG